MKIYEIKIDLDNYNFFGGEIDEDMFEGETLLSKWKPNKVKLENKIKKNGNFKAHICTVIYCDEKTKKILEPVLKNKVEFLKTNYKEDYWIINCLNVIDCIDYKKAKPYNTDSGEVIVFDEYSFKKSIIENELLFKIPEFKVQRLYCTENLKEIIEKNNLTAIYFEEIWDSEK